MNNHCHCNICPHYYHLSFIQQKQRKHVFNEDVYMPSNASEEDQNYRGKKRKLFNEKNEHPTNINDDHYRWNRYQNNNSNSVQSGGDARYHYMVNITCNKVPSSDINDKLDKTETITFTFN